MCFMGLDVAILPDVLPLYLFLKIHCACKLRRGSYVVLRLIEDGLMRWDLVLHNDRKSDEIWVRKTPPTEPVPRRRYLFIHDLTMSIPPLFIPTYSSLTRPNLASLRRPQD